MRMVSDEHDSLSNISLFHCPLSKDFFHICFFYIIFDFNAIK